MKYFLAVFFILFMVVSVFGFAGMTHANHDGSVSGGCITSILDSSVCVNDVLSMVIHHISAYQSFSQFLINYLGTTFFLLLLSALMAGMFLLWRALNLWLKHFSPFAFLRDKFKIVGRNANSQILNWLSLLENSPSFSGKA